MGLRVTVWSFFSISLMNICCCRCDCLYWVSFPSLIARSKSWYQQRLICETEK
ncbi:hypothetical protein BKA80DRAFT_275160 [Phyllosticta citrichinensis]